MKEIKKIVIANRGEIALRIMRTIREMGLKSVAVYSEADRGALHVRYADEAVYIGPPPSSQSYLLGEKIIEVALKTSADAIHPGYGFLSENADFARMTEAAGLLFIGPSPDSIRTMGSKIEAKKAASRYNIPMVPGTEGAVSDLEEACSMADKIGYPLLIKASAGGGGKGMRIVEKEEDLAEQMQRAVSEATSAFGDGSVFLEKYIVSPKHIEIQVLGDKHGNIVHLFERECSIQRRHQKVVEEAPSSILTPEIREAMGRCAVDVARSCNYYGAGTVEFIVDRDLNFYFLEMNTRLQVEHPVTEEITGKDLVKEQIRIAEGHPLSFKQEDLKIHGHAMEIRVYAEDPLNGFLPDTGVLHTYVRPQGPGVRTDDGFEEGMEVPVWYDPMIAKLIVHAATRQEAIRKMRRAIEEYKITGVATTLDFCQFVMQHEAFISGKFDTGFVDHYFSAEKLQACAYSDDYEKMAALMAGILFLENTPISPKVTSSERKSLGAWKSRTK